MHALDSLDNRGQSGGVVAVGGKNGATLDLEVEVCRVALRVVERRAAMALGISRGGGGGDKRERILRFVGLVQDALQDILTQERGRGCASDATLRDGDIGTTHPLLVGKGGGVVDTLRLTLFHAEGLIARAQLVVTQGVEVGTTSHKLDRGEQERVALLLDGGSEDERLVATHANIAHVDGETNSDHVALLLHSQSINRGIAVDCLLCREWCYM